MTLKNIRTILEEVLVVSDPAEMCYSEEEKRDVEFAKEIMEQCYVCDASQDQGQDEVEASIAVGRRRAKAKELLDFSRCGARLKEWSILALRGAAGLWRRPTALCP